MDLAKIRKKAKELKQDDKANIKATIADVACTDGFDSISSQAPQTCDEDSLALDNVPTSFPVQPDPVLTVEPNVVDDLPRNDLSDGMSTLKVCDPLDELFRQTPDIQLATEESYLQALDDDQSANENIRQWLTFSLADEVYALDIDTIDEICKPREVTEIPNAPEFVLGIISLRGKVVPVYDLRCRLQLGRIDKTPATRIIVCQTDEKLVGLLVDSITQVVRLADTDIEPPPMVLSGLDRDMIEGVGRSQGGILILLNLNNVITIDTD